MARYQVSFLVRDWIQVEVSAEDENEARAKGQKIVDKNLYKNGVDCIDGKTDFAGITNLDVLDKLED